MTPNLGPRSVAVLFLLGLTASAESAQAQSPVPPTLEGEVLLGGEPLGQGAVTLHRIAGQGAGTVEERPLGPDGEFQFELPVLPQGGPSGTAYVVSARFRGIPYFGPVVSRPEQTDSLYPIQVYDTTAAPTGGAALPMIARTVFVERAEDSVWRVSDFMRLRNAGGRTIVATAENVAWSHPLPPEATDFQAGESDLIPGTVFFRDSLMRVVAPISPGEHGYMVHYRIPELALTLPMPGPTERMDLLIQEPLPPLTVEGLSQVDSTDLGSRGIFRRFAATQVTDHEVRISPGERGSELPSLWWIAALVTLGLVAVGVAAARRDSEAAARPGGGTAPPEGERSTPGRRELLLRIAELDEIHEGSGDLTAEERERNRRERRRYKRLLEDPPDS